MGDVLNSLTPLAWYETKNARESVGLAGVFIARALSATRLVFNNNADSYVVHLLPRQVRLAE